MFEQIEFEIDPSFCYEATPSYCDERAVEVPWTLEVIRRFREKYHGPLKLCDVGCHGSRHLPLLAGEGMLLEGIDLQPCSLEGVLTRRLDIRDFEPPCLYDLVTCISTLEHIGFEVYGGRRSEDWFGEQVKSVLAMKRMLKKNGILILTLPLGRRELFISHAVYDLPLLDQLAGEAHLEKLEVEMYHFDLSLRNWRKSNPDSPNRLGYAEGVRFATGVVLAVLR